MRVVKDRVAYVVKHARSLLYNLKDDQMSGVIS